MNWKIVPYIFILVFSSVITVIRYIIIPQWKWTTHILLFFLQAFFLIIVWLFIKFLSTILDKYYPFSKSPVKRVIIQIVVAITCIAPVYVALTLNAHRFNLAFMNKQFLVVTSILFALFIMLMNLGYNAYYFFKQWQLSVEEKAKLEVATVSMAKEKSLMQYQHLKNQVNPHFLFNTLTSLDGLILSDPELASQFVRHLSKVYRYVLEHRENEIVSLQTEIDFISHYISVLKIKHNEALDITMNISTSGREKGIAMVTLQMLIDNAIKHNIVHEKTPLKILIKDENNILCIENNKQLRRQIETSTKHGLKHLQQLYSFLTPAPVVIEDTTSLFIIKLPLL